MIEPKIIYEDNHVIVVIKPQNISVQADSSKDIDMLTIIKNYIKQRDNKPGNVFLGLVHRLDRPTGGVMVFAKTSKAASRLTEQLKKKQLKKKYFCVVNGRPQLVENRLVTYLKKDEKTNTVKIAPQLEEGSKEAILEYKVVETKNKLSLIDVNLITGRSHQIRVQMSGQLNTPIYGDFKYGDKLHGGALALWSYELTFIHPITKENMKFKVAPDYNNPAFKIFEKTIEKIIN
ncbi:MAG TPA: RluA family pseudouridine synthase [Candidatus Onthoplasma faecigallinarum]|nr:RluA family pseudouridine synthase [Candidatus Onthoplasma faecigallinarum]